MPRSATQFKPGQSGNPGGRPKMPVEVQELARGYTVEAIESLAAIMRNHKMPAPARVAAANAILDRGYGRPAQAITDPSGEGPVELKVTWLPPVG